jgi:hypothetical protein
MERDWFAKAFRILITFIVFAVLIAGVFYRLEQNWIFLTEWGYWIDTTTSTAIAFMFRWLYSDSGLQKELELNKDIIVKENGKRNLVGEVNSKGLTDLLDLKIKKENKKAKLHAYQIKDDETRELIKGTFEKQFPILLDALEEYDKVIRAIERMEK